MGYRLNILDKQHPELEFYGTKLYGYVADETKLASLKYLISIGKMWEDAIWDYSFYNETHLTQNEFNTFIKLYEEDLLNYGPIGHIKLSDDDEYWKIERMMETNGDKILTWL